MLGIKTPSHLHKSLPRSPIGSDIKGNTIVPESDVSNSYEDQSLYFFEKYSKDLLIEVKDPC